MPLCRLAICRFSKLIVLIAMFVVCLSACSNPTPSPLPETMITFACYRNELAFYQDAADEFHKINPGLYVRLVLMDDILSNAPQDALERLHYVAARADTFLWSSRGIDGGPANLVSDLTPFVQGDKEMDESAFWPGMLTHFRDQNRTWGIPAAVNPSFVLFDPAAFDQAGLAHPEPGWTWGDFFLAAQQLVQREGEYVHRYGVYLNRDAARSLVEGLGGQLIDASSGALVPALDDPNMVAAMQQFADLVRTGQVMLDTATEQPVDLVDVVLHKKTAMSLITAQLWDGQARRRAQGLDISPLPGSSSVRLGGYYISAGAAHPQAAWLWLRFLSLEEPPRGWMPARQALLDGSAFGRTMDNQTLTILRYAAEHALPPVRPVGVEQLFDQAVEQVLAGEPVQAVLTSVQHQALVWPTPAPVGKFQVNVPPSALVGTAEQITFVTTDAQAYFSLVEVFRQEHPEIKVIVLEAAEATNQTRWVGPADLIAKTQADCVCSGGAVQNSETRQALLNLQPFIETDATLPLDDYIPWTLDQMRYEGSVWGLPAGVSVDVLYYNRALFDETGISCPDRSWKWDDLFQVARQIARNQAGEQRYGFILWPDSRIFPLFQSLSESLIDPAAQPPAFLFDTPDAVGAARKLAALVQDQVVPDAGDAAILYDLIYKGQVAMWTASAREFEIADREFCPAYLPQEGYQFSMGTSSCFISASTPHAQASWMWLRFLADYIPYNDDLQFGAKSTSKLPSRRSLLASQEFQFYVGGDAQAIYLDALERMRPEGETGLDTLPVYANRAYRFLDAALQQIVWQDADAQTELSQAQFKADAYLACLRRQSDQDAAAAQTCYEQVEADAARP